MGAGRQQHAPAEARGRRSIAVSGVVQGVGFRPFVFGLASRLGLQGFVKNRQGGVLIEVEGSSATLDAFLAELHRGPPLARVQEVQWAEQVPLGNAGFRIEASDGAGASQVFISPDVATCDDCLRELFDINDRRYRYPFLNCTNCGPRLTIVKGAPYDRERTTMAAFALCADCRAEYEDPRNRRFHAQPVACPACGPRLRLLDASGDAQKPDDAVAAAAARLRRGDIGAIKGIGGYHLACDARDEAAVAALRGRKAREEKPFALMVADLAAAEALCEVSAAEREQLTSPARPIVLLRRRDSAPIAATVAPGSPLLGLMLPYAPLHHLLLHDFGAPLVLTSGNRSDEPIACEDRDALERLSGIADFFLVHDRPIHTRCDDSVLRVVDGAPLPFRRSRGYAPLPVALPVPLAVPTLALGGQLKATFALGEGRHAFLSHHLGDLDHYRAYCAFVTSIEHYQELYRITPQLVVHDLHPDYASTRYAQALSGVRLLAVQHHHAHFASCLADNGLVGPAIGVSFDGTGFGSDGTLWGGEFLVGDCRQARRVAHLAASPLPGGEQAIREPWRAAVAQLVSAGLDPRGQPLAARIPAGELRAVLQMLRRSFNSPLSSSVGRLFDAVAALAGVCDRASFEGQAAIRLEALAEGAAPEPPYPFELSAGSEPIVAGVVPLIEAVVRDVSDGAPPAIIARRFHSTVVELIGAVCERLAETTGLDAVALSGGVFMNAILTRETVRRLQRAGLRAYRHRLVPPNDGGLCLGQLAVAAALAAEEP